MLSKTPTWNSGDELQVFKTLFRTFLVGFLGRFYYFDSNTFEYFPPRNQLKAERGVEPEAMIQCDRDHSDSSEC